MFTTIITDCKGENEKGRQVTRCNSLGLGPTNLIGVDSGLGEIATIEAAGNLIDTLDASEGKKGVVIVNVAPRGNKKDGVNGTLFCYFNYKNTLVISTIGGYTLSLVKQFGLVKKVNVLETQQALEFAVKQKLISKKLSKYIVNTQFRSFDFAPRVAKWLFDGIKILSSAYSLYTIPNIPTCIWCIDAFGNCKLTITSRDLKLNNKKFVKTNLGTFSFLERLKDIPKVKTAIYIGSSGLKNKRFLEIATQGKPGSAAETLNLKVGSKIKFY